MINRDRGTVFIFGIDNLLWCTGIKETDEYITGFVQNGHWYLHYDKKQKIIYCYREYGLHNLVNRVTDTELTNRVKVHWKFEHHCDEYNYVIERARKELINPTESEFDEPIEITQSEMLIDISNKILKICDYNEAQYQCTIGSVVIYACERDAFDDEIPF
jgi:hypothetical protein